MDDAPYQRLSPYQRREALQVAARSSGNRTYVLEKDIWVVADLGRPVRSSVRKAPGLQRRHLPVEGVASNPQVFGGHRHHVRHPRLRSGSGRRRGRRSASAHPRSGETLDEGDPSALRPDRGGPTLPGRRAGRHAPWMSSRSATSSLPSIRGSPVASRAYAPPTSRVRWTRPTPRAGSGPHRSSS